MTKNQNLTPAIFLLFDEIDLEVSKLVVEWILKNNVEEKPHESITLVVNSEGGELSAAFSVIDFMNNSKIPIRTIGTGEVLSAGLMIFMNGESGFRTITPNTSILSHRLSAETSGKYHDIMSMQKEFAMLNERMITHYLKCTNLSREEIEKNLICGEDIYLSPTEALSFGICDSIG